MDKKIESWEELLEDLNYPEGEETPKVNVEFMREASETIDYVVMQLKLDIDFKDVAVASNKYFAGILDKNYYDKEGNPKRQSVANADSLIEKISESNHTKAALLSFLTVFSNFFDEKKLKESYNYDLSYAINLEKNIDIPASYKDYAFEQVMYYAVDIKRDGEAIGNIYEYHTLLSPGYMKNKIDNYLGKIQNNLENQEYISEKEKTLIKYIEYLTSDNKTMPIVKDFEQINERIDKITSYPSFNKGFVACLDKIKSRSDNPDITNSGFTP